MIVNGVAVWREALTLQIDRCADLKVCGQALDEAGAFKAVRRLRPSLVLTEILCPENLGFIRQLHQRRPRLPILVFSCRDEQAYALRAMEAGACGYLMQTITGARLVAGVRRALAGRRVLSAPMAARLRRLDRSRPARSPPSR